VYYILRIFDTLKKLTYMHHFQITRLGLVACLLALLAGCSSKRSDTPSVLVFSKTMGYHHESIADGITAIQKLGAEHGFQVDTTTNSAYFTEENLKQYAAVIWLSTTGDVLNHYQEADFERYIQSGGGYVGIHAAADTEYEWGWYNRLAGGYFADHPGINDPHPNVQPGIINVTDRKHSSTSFLPEKWNRTDEWYSYKKMNPDVKVLMDLDESSYQGGLDMGYHPIAWYHEYDGGRAFYTGGGHTRESFYETDFLKHLLAGIQYAIGKNAAPDFKRVKTQRVPEANRFEKTMLVLGEFTEPTEMTILPNLDILVAQRRGEILLYKNGDSTVREIAKLDVYWKTETPGVNAEEGLMGLQKDPNFAKNGYVFAYYSPKDKEVNRLSRFHFANDQLDLKTEKIILELYSQRNICCHTGGSIAFDKGGNLYLSTGDNSTPFDQPTKYMNNGYAPLDDRPNMQQYDARRTSGNANDLRGKIIRIKVNDDGSYSIPNGNLYPKGTEGTRPEIYVQGNRNPYRISVDQKSGFLYWGEVGPDANLDSLNKRGPRGYDEVNQARQAGNFGWPYFVGNNYAYWEYDYDKNSSAFAFDPAKPINNSRNNTGIKELPPAQPAFIWYPYGVSPDFPQVGTGGRNAMAGPVYHSDLYPTASRYPAYYDGKLFIYDWVRGWIKAVTMQPNGDFDKMEPFMPGVVFNAPMDMEVGPDGKIYLLEYGNGWFSKNADSGLSRIDFNGGNRTPMVYSINASETSGILPFTTVLTADAADPENDPLVYTWDLGNGERIVTKEPRLEYTYKSVGDYSIRVEVSDPGELRARSQALAVYAGNVAPVINIRFQGNQSFYFPGKQVKYTVSVTDPDDPEAGNDLSDLIVSADYVSGLDQAEASQGHLIMTDAMLGKGLIASLTCKTCHKENEASIGPAYADVSKKYLRSLDATDYLLNKIKNGGSGVWGEVAMPANPDLKDDDARKIIAYILSLGQTAAEKGSLPPSGSVNPTLGKQVTDNGVFLLSASFTDRGGDNIRPLTSTANAYLNNPKIGMDHVNNLNSFSRMTYNGMTMMLIPNNEASFSVPAVDLTDIAMVQITGGGQEASKQGFVIELRLDSPNGKKIGESRFKISQPGPGGFLVGFAMIPVEPVTDGKKHDLYIVTRPAGEGEGVGVFMNIEFKAR
jgi:cytochrome c